MKGMHTRRPHKEKSEGRHAQSLVNRPAATAMPALHGTNSTKFIITKRSTLIQNLARQVQQHRNMAGPNGIYVVFSFHVLGGR
jgi:hypothetical protein